METPEKHVWTKTCAYCKKKYQTTARRQKYCCPECGVKMQKRKKEQKVRYEKIKEVERLRVRAHSIAVQAVKLLCEMGVREWKCDCCGAEDKLQVHHKDLVWLNNTPSNLALFCTKCHARAHSDLEFDLNEKGILVEEYYEKSFQPFAKVINK